MSILNPTAVAVTVCLSLLVTPGIQAQSRPFGAAPSSYATEQQWIEADVRSRIGRMAHQAEPNLPAPPSEDVIGTCVWDPARYIEFARKLLGPVPAGSSQGSPELLSRLTTPTLDALLGENARISRTLAADPRAAGPHEDAGVLIGAFALREAAGPFTDVRATLSEMTAHLAVGRALSGGTGRNGRAADAILSALAGRQRDTLDRLAAWTAAVPDGAERSWINALTLRASGDWRQLADPAHASLLERLAYVRVLHDRVGTSNVVRFLDESHPEPIIDWSRLLTDQAMPVDVGQWVARAAIDTEVAEATLVWRALEPARGAEAATVSQLVDLLNLSTGNDAQVIGWPMWAASYQRHLARQVATAIDHESRMLGRKEKALALATALEEQFGRLTLFPLAKREYALDARQYRAAMLASMELIATHPEAVTSANWTMLTERSAFAAPPDYVPPPAVWFDPLVPAGTGFDVQHRLFGPRRTLLARPDVLARLRTIAPFERDPLFELLRIRRGSHVPLDELVREAGAMADYDVTVMTRLATAAWADRQAYTRIASRLCVVDVDRCDLLAAYLADHDDEDEAAAAYQKWAVGTRDRVGFSNGIGWLVSYYARHDEPKRALALADEAAEVYSSRGLATKARLLERSGDYAGAEALQTAIAERYPGGAEVDRAAFYLRWAATPGNGHLRDKATPIVSNIFPGGMKPYQRLEPEQAPPDGARVTWTGARGATAGFHVNDIVVAVDGIGVHGYDQFLLAWQMRADPVMTFVVWNGSKYVEIRGDLRERWTSGYFVSYDYRTPILP
jgi:hypothetical protein